MMPEQDDLLESLKYELKYVQAGGYRRSPRIPWRPPMVCEETRSCLDFEDSAHPHPCPECWLHQFVPTERQEENAPCRFIPLNAKGDTLDSLHRRGTQEEMETALANWLRARICEIEQRTR